MRRNVAPLPDLIPSHREKRRPPQNNKPDLVEEEEALFFSDANQLVSLIFLEWNEITRPRSADFKLVGVFFFCVSRRLIARVKQHEIT